MFAKIVVGLDGSETSDKALRVACDMAQKYGSEIHLVHTPQPITVAYALGNVAGFRVSTSLPTQAEVKEAAEKIIDQGKAIATEYGLTVAGTDIGAGDPAEHIITQAEACGADLIVTGRRGLGSVSALLQGSTTQKVNHHARCACLSVV